MTRTQNQTLNVLNSYTLNDDQYEEIYAYNDIIRHNEKDNNDHVI